MTSIKNIIKALDLLQAVLLQNDEKDELQLQIQEFLRKSLFQVEMTEDEFYKEFNCVKNHLDSNASFDGCMFETYGADLLHIQELCKSDVMKHCVWTIIEAEGKFFYVSGFHYVNRFGYLITEEPVKDGLEIEVAIDTEVDKQPETRTAKLVEEITVVDPDSKGDVELSIYKHENGGMFAMDSSFLDQVVNTDDFDRPIIPDPFSDSDVEAGTINHVVLFD